MGAPQTAARETHTRLQLLRPAGDDGGFTMAEVIIAFVLFMILAGSAGVALTNTLSVSHANSSRVVAANLAAREMETIRGLDADQLVDGAAPTRTVVIDGQNYYLDRTTTLDTAGGTGSACSGASGPAAFKRVTVHVSWDKMDGVRPIQSDTLKALSVQGLSDGTGVVSVPVQDAAGAGVAGVNVSLGALNRSTQSDGCAVFAGVAPGSYVAVASASGYVGRNSEPTVSSSALTVLAGEITKAPALIYDRATTLELVVNAPSGYPVPALLGSTLGSTIFTGSSKAFPACMVGPTSNCTWVDTGRLRIGWLFPATTGYQTWTGTCSTAMVAGSSTVVVTPGGSTTATPPSMGGVAATVKTGAAFRSGYSLTATNTSCSTESFTFTGLSGTSDAQALKSALPAGTWRLQAYLGAVPQGTTTTVTVTSGAVVGGGVPVVVNVP